MPEIYGTIQRERLNLSSLAFDYRDQADWTKTLGHLVMNHASVRAGRRSGNYVYDDEVVAYLHAALTENGWEWQPSNDDTNGGGVLDFVLPGGNCRYVSSALELLFYAPAPFGFELPQGSVKTVGYPGRNKVGFIARHDPAKAFGLGYNIITPVGRLLEGYFLWGNHFVTDWPGDRPDDEQYYRYYDANYNRCYRKLGEMALVEMAKGFERGLDPRWTTYQQVLETDDLTDTEQEALDGIYVVTKNNDYATRLLPELAETLNTRLGFDSRTTPVVGPFPRPYDETKSYMIDLG